MKKIFIACDTKNLKKIEKILRLTKIKSNTFKIGYKFGLEFFYSQKGRSFISKFKSDFIFLDLKINDIPNTAVEAIRSLKDLKRVKYITIHLNGGYEMIKAVKKETKKINKKIKILGVSVLTSLTNKSLKELGYKKSIKDIVRKQALLAKKAKLDGVICSANEAKFLKSICNSMEIITPGIRLLGDRSHDQKRITTPSEAFANGATSIIVGRSITKGNIKKNLQKLINSLI